MASGDPVDMQRGKRWPSAEVNGIKVKFKAWEEDEDFSDQEGVVPPIAGIDPVTGKLIDNDGMAVDDDADDEW
jgi:hypothetical protein